MTITDVRLVRETGGQSDQGPTYERTYQVYFANGYSAAALIVNTDSRLPKYGYPLRSPDGNTIVDDTVYCFDCKMSLAEKSAATEGIAEYVAQYKIIPPNLSAFGIAGASINFEPNPLNRKPEIRGGGSDLTFYAPFGRDGRLIANSAYDVVDPQPPQPLPGREIQIVQNEPNNPSGKSRDYSNTVNAAQWYEVGKYNGKMGKIDFDEVHEVIAGTDGILQIVRYYRTIYPIITRRDSWRYSFADVGFRQLGTDGKPTEINDPKTGFPVTVPQPLDGSGHALPPGSIPPLFPPSGKEYKLMDEVDWNLLNLPNPFTNI